MNDIDKLFEFFKLVRRLKLSMRWDSVPGIAESTAEHSFQMAIMAIFLPDFFPDLKLDKMKVIKMALLHDVTEAVFSDISQTKRLQKPEFWEIKKEQEAAALSHILSILPDGARREFSELLHEYEERKSIESKFVKVLDQLESLPHAGERGPELAAGFYMPGGLFGIMKQYGSIPEMDFLLRREMLAFKKVILEKGMQWFPEWEEKLNTVADRATPDLDKLFDFFKLIRRLKLSKRYDGAPILSDSSAEHSFQMAVMAIFLPDFFPNLKLDKMKVIKMALLHDTDEAVFGDISHNKRHVNPDFILIKKEQGAAAIKHIISILPKDAAREFGDIIHEYEERQTLESKFVKNLDLLESVPHIAERGVELDPCLFRPEGYDTIFKLFGKVPEMDFLLEKMLLETRDIVKAKGINCPIDWDGKFAALKE